MKVMNKNAILQKIEKLLKDKQFTQAWEQANKINDISLLGELGYLFKKYSQWANAINFFNYALKHQPNNKAYEQEKTFLLSVLKMEQLDIFADTNLNKDPWFE